MSVTAQPAKTGQSEAMDMRSFLKMTFSLVLPMAIQNLINTAITSADVVMLGKVGETALSASSLAGQVQFIMNLIFFGLTSGAAVLTAQYWGKRDIETIDLELIFSDMEMVERRIAKTSKELKGNKSLQGEVDFLNKLYAHLDSGKCARSLDIDDDEKAILATIDLLTSKPIIYAANMSEDDFASGIGDNAQLKAVEALAAEEGSQVLPICAQMEADIAEMSAEEKLMFLSELGLEHSGLDRLIQKSYTLLGLISFLTAGEKEVRAWTIRNGLKAPQAAGKIHTDFERGFIRAQVVAYDDLAEAGSLANARVKGLVRTEGKEYVMKDGDVVEFLFNV